MATYLRDMFLYSGLLIECSVCESTVVLYRTVQQQSCCMIPYFNMLIWDAHGIVHDLFNNFGRLLIHCHFYVDQDRFTLTLRVKCAKFMGDR